ncbi:MAG: thaumatin family protein [Gammaproteobacteria bacterium]|nr:thaumatin family protein [Gammaproteobacteria bacterium]
MRKNIVVLFVLSLFLLSSPLQAAHAKKKNLGKDPVGWSISPSGFPAQTTVGSSYVVTYTMTNNLPFAVPLTVSGAYNGGKFALSHGCNTTLQPKGTCLVHLTFQPIKAGVSNAVVTLAYHRNRVPLPQLSSTATSNETPSPTRSSGHVSTPLPGFVYVGISYPVVFTFANNGNTPITTTSVNVVGFTATTNTCTTGIAEHSNCTVSGNFTPAAVGPVALSVTYTFSGGSVPLTTQSDAIILVGTCHQISGNTILPLPTNTLINADNVVEYVFTNNCPATTETISAVKVTSDSVSASPPRITQGSVQPVSPLVTCSSTLAPTASCAVFASVIPTATYTETQDLSVTAALSYNNGTVADTTTSETVSPLSNDASVHYFQLNNQNALTVWYGFNTGGVPGDPTSNSAWQDYQLDQQIQGAAPATKILQLSQYHSGNMFGRTECETDPSQANYGICQTANCTALGSSTGKCSYAPNPPFTIFEENLYTAASGTADGVYDVSMVNGFNLPGEIRSLSSYVPITSTSNFGNTCGNSAGALIQPSGSALGVCSWLFTPPSKGGTDCTTGTDTDNSANYFNVSYASANDSCTPGSCTGTDVCGMSQSLNSSSVPVGTPIYRHCGTFHGYWVLADWIGFSTSGSWGTTGGPTCNLYSHYNMGTALDLTTYGYSTRFPNSNPMPGSNLADLYGCSPTSLLSCYTSPGTPNICFNSPTNPYYALNTGYAFTYNVCGCHDWNNASTTPASAQTAQSSQCTATNTLWETDVYPRILWLKEACPTAYSYQFDDKSSSFQCNVSGHLTSYQLTFSPGGKTGAP